MTFLRSPKPPALFWILGALFVIWNLFGCAAYLMDNMMSDAAYAETYGAEMAAVRDLYPVWAMASYAIAVWGGLVAAILFLLRKKLAVPIFILSLISAIICFIPSFTMDALRNAAGDMFWFMPALVVILGVFEVWYARRMRAKGILR